MDARYHFRLGLPAQKLFTSIRETRQGVEFFSASEAGQVLELTDSHLLKQVGFAPVSMLKVIALIHWWALKIFIKGGKVSSYASAFRSYSNTVIRRWNYVNCVHKLGCKIYPVTPKLAAILLKYLPFERIRYGSLTVSIG